MTSTEPEVVRFEVSRRALRGIGFAGVVIVIFGVGYSLGWFRSEATPDNAVFQGAEADLAARQVASLNDLLPGLEAKVKANPDDASQRRLLAQTYAELGQVERSIEHLRVLHKQAPGDTETTILLATSLLERGEANGLKESYALLEDVLRAKPAVLPMVRLYQGEIHMKQGDKPGAIKIWKTYLGQTSAGDPRRRMFQERIEQAGGQS